MIDPELEELFHIASRFVADRFRQTGAIAPMWHAVASDGQHIILAPPARDKAASFVLMRALFSIRGVVRYVFFNEGWMLHVKDRDLRPGELDAGLEGHPDRREVVFFTGEAKGHGCVLAHRFILRPEHGRATLAPLVMHDATEGENEGRLIGLLN